MDPFTIMMLGSAVVQGGASIYGATKKYDAYKQQELNILRAAIQNRDMIEAQTNVAVEQLQYRNRFKKAIEINKIAGSGINPTGSAADVYAQNEYFGELDVYRTRLNGEMKMKSYVTGEFNKIGELESGISQIPAATGINLLSIAAGTVADFAKNGKYNQLNLNNMNNISQLASAKQAGINQYNEYIGIDKPSKSDVWSSSFSDLLNSNQ